VIEARLPLWFDSVEKVFFVVALVFFPGTHKRLLGLLQQNLPNAGEALDGMAKVIARATATLSPYPSALGSDVRSHADF
jgi:hypothetical protein